jgi:hypothetical protein
MSMSLMHKISFAFAASGLLVFATPVISELLVSDSFESGNMSPQIANGFRWSDTKVTSVVNKDTEVYITSDTNLPAPENSQWEAKTGDHALMLRYRAGKSWTEQKFYLQRPERELWMSFWLRVPTNYAHPEVEGANDNQKLFRLWMDDYGHKGDGSTVGMSFRGDGYGGSYFFAKIAGGGDKGKVPFITIPDDRGEWMHLVVQVKSESSPDEKDGVMGVWRKWDGDSGYTKTHDFRNQPIKLSTTKKGFAAGYLMGWANAVYPVDTEFLVDDFKLSTTPLL